MESRSSQGQTSHGWNLAWQLAWPGRSQGLQYLRVFQHQMYEASPLIKHKHWLLCHPSSEQGKITWSTTSADFRIQGRGVREGYLLSGVCPFFRFPSHSSSLVFIPRPTRSTGVPLFGALVHSLANKELLGSLLSWYNQPPGRVKQISHSFSCTVSALVETSVIQNHPKTASSNQRWSRFPLKGCVSKSNST